MNVDSIELFSKASGVGINKWKFSLIVFVDSFFVGKIIVGKIILYDKL